MRPCALSFTSFPARSHVLCRLLALLLFLIAVSAASARADCIDYSKDMHVVTALERPGAAVGVAVEGNNALLAEQSCLGGVSCLDIVDITDPLVPVPAGLVELTNWGVRVAVSGNHAYVTEEGYEGYAPALQIVDISDPHAPQLAGSLALLPGVLGVAVSGSYAFVANGSYGLQIIDVSDPLRPCLAATLPTHGSARGVAVRGHLLGTEGCYAYVAEGDGGLLVVELGSPRNPRVVGFSALDQSYTYPEDVVVSGEIAYVTTRFRGLFVVDVSVPATPRVLGRVQTPEVPYSLAVSGSRVYVADAMNGLTVIDVSDPENPHIDGTVGCGYLYSCAVSGEFVFAAGYFRGLEVIDVSGDRSTQPLGSVTLPPMAQGVAVAGNYAYFGCGNAGLQAVDVADPAHPAIVGTLDTPGWAARPAILGPYVCLPDAGSVVHVIDVADPTSPREVSQLNTFRGSTAVAVDDRYAYVSADSYFEVFDLADPHHPHREGFLSAIPSGPIQVAGAYAYLGEWNYLRIIDIADPAHPVQVGQMQISGTCGLAISGSLLYMAVNYPPRLCIIDVSNPSDPVVVSSHACVWWTTDVALGGHDAYLANYGGVEVVDVEDPLRPANRGEGDTPDLGNGIVVANGVVYLSVSGQGYFSGLIAFPTQCPDQQWLREAPLPLVATRGSQLSLRMAPNPARDRAGFGFTLPVVGDVTLAIYDPAGKLVRVLHDGALPAGTARLEWDGRDSRGRALATGPYLARISASGAVETAKIYIQR